VLCELCLRDLSVRTVSAVDAHPSYIGSSSKHLIL